MIGTSKEYQVEVVGDDDNDVDDEDDVSNDDDAAPWKRRRRRRRRPHRLSLPSPAATSSCSSSTPILSEPPSSSSTSLSSSIPLLFVPHYLQTLSTAIVAFSALICILISATSCQFLTVSHTIQYYYYNYDNDATINNDDDEISNNNNSNNNYVTAAGAGGQEESTTSFSSSFGIFCTSNNDDDDNNIKYDIIEIIKDYADTNGNDIMLSLSRAFTFISILCSVVLSLLTIAISTTCLSSSMTTTKLWNGREGSNDGAAFGVASYQICNISFLSAITFVFTLPMLFLLDSHQCKNTTVGGGYGTTNNPVDDSITRMMDITNQCALGAGSIPLLISMGLHVALAVVVYWIECPDWREEYELWKLMKQQRMKGSNNANNREKGINEGGKDEEQGGLGTMITMADDDECRNRHPSAFTGRVASPAIPKQLPSGRLPQQQQQQPTKKAVGYNQKGGKVMDESHGIDNNRLIDSNLQHPHFIFNGTRNNVNTLSPPTSPSTPPPPPPISPPIENNDDILHDLDTSLLTTSVASNSSREWKKRELSKFLREERCMEVNELNSKRNHFPLHHLPSTVVVAAPFLSGYGNGVDGEAKQPTSGTAIIENQHRLNTKASSTARHPIVSIRIKRNVGDGLESTKATTSITTATEVVDNERSESLFNVNELEWPSTAKVVMPRSVHDAPSSPSSMRIKMMKTSSPLTKFSSRMDIMVVDVNNNDANPIVHVVHDDDDDDDEQDEGGGTGSNNDNRSCMVREDADSSVNSIQRSLNGAHISGADVVATSASVASARIVTPEKRDHDPEIDIYPSDGSLSTLSLGTEDCRSTDDEDPDNKERYCPATKQNQQPQQEQQQHLQQAHQQQDHVRQEHQQQEQPQHKQLDAIPTNQNYNFLSDGYSSEDSELSAVIAGVQKLNRKTSGKITPLNKRRRRKRRSTGSGNGQSSSGSMSASSFSSRGSLLDEVIVEEGELNSSNEGMAAAMIVNANEIGDENRRNTVDLGVPNLTSASRYDEASAASPINATKKKDRRRRMHDNDISKEDGCGSINSDGSSNTVDSNISRAARGRRNRIATQRQSRIDPDGEYDLSSSFSRPASPDDIPEPHNLHQSNVRNNDNHRGINNRPTPIASAHCNSNVEQQNAWQARRIRMKRLRMIRGHDFVVRGAGSGGSSSDGDVDDDDLVQTSDVANKERYPACGVSRANAGVILACSSDEDSI